MPRLIALALSQDARMAHALRSIWDDGDAACVLDPRWSAPVRADALAALRPSAIETEDGRTTIDGGEDVEEGDALVVLSSGSMAAPKAAVLTREAVMASATLTSEALGVDPKVHRWLCCLPASHIGGLSVIMRAQLTGTPLEVTARADPASLVEMARCGVSHVSLVATVLRRIDPSLFTCILLGGAAPPAALPPNVVTTYGSTETGSGVIYDGRALPGVRIQIDEADADGIGEILLDTPTALRCYRDRPAPFTAGADGSGRWLRTGDLGRLSEAGDLEVFGRVDEVIVTGAEKVFPLDVEAVIATLDGVAEVAVWKRPDEEWGERVVAWIVPDGTPPSLSEVRSAVSERIARYAAPREIELVESLPRTGVGKLRRRSLS